MTDRNRDERGRFQPDHEDDEYVDAVRECEPAATSEVAGKVGVPRQNADRRLRRLEDQGRVRSKMVGNSLVWMPASDE